MLVRTGLTAWAVGCYMVQPIGRWKREDVDYYFLPGHPYSFVRAESTKSQHDLPGYRGLYLSSDIDKNEPQVTPTASWAVDSLADTVRWYSGGPFAGNTMVLSPKDTSFIGYLTTYGDVKGHEKRLGHVAAYRVVCDNDSHGSK